MSLSTTNVARRLGKEYGLDLSVSDVKLLLHNAAIVERLFSTFGKSPNLMKNNTDFKELLFYGYLRFLGIKFKKKLELVTKIFFIVSLLQKKLI